MAKTYLIKSIFGPTIQGEGSHAGAVVSFIRFSGCNRWTGRPEDKPKPNTVCWFCDTDFLGGEKLTIDEIIKRLTSLAPPGIVVISGGEATLQIDKQLLEELNSFGFTLHLETNGSKDIGDLAKYFEHITVSPKQTLEKTHLKWAHDLKLLYPPPIEGLEPDKWTTFQTIRGNFLQPVDGPGVTVANTKMAVQYCLTNPDWRISVQVHKILGVE